MNWSFDSIVTWFVWISGIITFTYESWDRYESFPLLNKTWSALTSYPTGIWIELIKIHTTPVYRFTLIRINIPMNISMILINISMNPTGMKFILWIIPYDIFRLIRNMKYLTFKWLVGHENGPDDVKKARWVVYRVAQQVITSL